MTPLIRNILVGGVILVLATLISGLVFWDLPIEQQISQLRMQLISAKNDELSQEASFNSLSASSSTTEQQIAQLALFDLRGEEKADNVEELRSNTILSQLLDIFQAATISIDKLDPAPPKNTPITNDQGGAPLASVDRKNFQMDATGLYSDWVEALGKLAKLPPTVTVDHYTMNYLGKSQGGKAKVGVTMDLSFAFLKKASGSAAPQAAANAFQEMLQHLSNVHSELPSHLRGVPSRTGGSSMFQNMLAQVNSWLVPPAEARELAGRQRHVSSRRSVAPRRPLARIVVGPSSIRVEADHPIRFSTFRLNDDREVVDMPGIHVPTWSRRLDRPGLRAVRVGQYLPSTGRLVLVTDGRELPVFHDQTGSVVVQLDHRVRGHERSLPESKQAASQAPDTVLRRVAVWPDRGEVPVPQPAPRPFLKRVFVRPWQDTQPVRLAEALRRVNVQPWLDADIQRVDVRPVGQLLIDPQLAPIGAHGSLAAALGFSKVTSFSNLLGLANAPGRLGASPPGTPSASASGQPNLLTTPLSGNQIQVGRAEPFWPIIDATDDASIARWEAQQATLKATGSAALRLPSLAGDATARSSTTKARHPFSISLLGLLSIGDQSAAMLEVNGQSMRAYPGTTLAPGYRVQAIGQDYILVKTPSGVERHELARIWGSPDKRGLVPEPLPTGGDISVVPPAPPSLSGSNAR